MADLTGAGLPPNVNTTVGSLTSMPSWYQDYVQSIAGQGVNLANSLSNADVPAQSVAGFNPMQQQAFQNIEGNQNSWQPGLNSAFNAANTIVPSTQTILGKAASDVAGPAQTWSGSAASQYMSPYTQNVIDNIQRLGDRNFNENLMPAVQSQFLGSGQFGSTRNADILGRTVRDNAADTNGQVANALNAGYTNAQTAFTSDANRVQQQQQMQTSADLQGAQIAGNAGASAAGALGNLTNQQQNLQLNDVQQLAQAGQQQQNLQQSGLNAGYNNAVDLQNFDWNTLGNMNSILRGMQLNSGTTQTANMPLPGSQYSSSPLTNIGALGTVLTQGGGHAV